MQTLLEACNASLARYRGNVCKGALCSPAPVQQGLHGDQCGQDEEVCSQGIWAVRQGLPCLQLALHLFVQWIWHPSLTGLQVIVCHLCKMATRGGVHK